MENNEALLTQIFIFISLLEWYNCVFFFTKTKILTIIPEKNGPEPAPTACLLAVCRIDDVEEKPPIVMVVKVPEQELYYPRPLCCLVTTP